MYNESFGEHSEYEPSRINRVGKWIANAFREARQQLRTADLNQHEGRLRSSAAPSEYLPQVPDYPPDDNDPTL